MAQISAELVTPVLVSDKDIGDINDIIYYPIASGGEMSYYTYPANAFGVSAITYNLNLPNTTSIIGRDMLQQATIQFTVTCANVPVGSSCFQYGQSDAFAAFPLNSLINTISATVNGAQFSNTLYQYKDIYLRTLSKKELSKYSSYTPAMPDRPFYNYSAGIGTNCNVLSTATNQSYDSELIPRGAYPLTSVVVTHNISGGGSDASTISTNVGDTWSIVITATLCEPFLCLEPFLAFGKDDGAGGFIGQQTINLQITLNNGSRLWSSSTGYIQTLTINNISSPVFYYKAIALNPIEAAKLPRFVTYPYNYVNYATTNQSGSITAGSTATATTQNYQFDRVPHKIYLSVRKASQSQTWNDASVFLPISAVSVTFNVKTGLLASATQRQLWMMTTENMGAEAAPSWEEFSGLINVQGTAGTGYATQVPSSGAILCFRPV